MTFILKFTSDYFMNGNLEMKVIYIRPIFSENSIPILNFYHNQQSANFSAKEEHRITASNNLMP